MNDSAGTNGDYSILDKIYDYMEENSGDFEYLFWYRMHTEARLNFPRPNDKEAICLDKKEKDCIKSELINMCNITDPEMDDKIILTTSDYVRWEADIISRILESMEGIKFYKIVYTINGVGGFTTFADEYDLPIVCSEINETSDAAICLVEETKEDEDITAYIKLVTYIIDEECDDSGEPFIEDAFNEQDEDDKYDSDNNDSRYEDMNEDMKNLPKGKFSVSMLNIKRLNHSYDEVGHIFQMRGIDKETHQDFYASIDTTSGIRGDVFRVTDKDYIELVLGVPELTNHLQPFTIIYEKPCDKVEVDHVVYKYYEFLKTYYEKYFSEHETNTFLNFPERYFVNNHILYNL